MLGPLALAPLVLPLLVLAPLLAGVIGDETLSARCAAVALSLRRHRPLVSCCQILRLSFVGMGKYLF